MHQISNPTDADVFISYSSWDRERVLEIASHLELAGVRVWLDRRKIDGGMNYGAEIVRAIKGCRVLMLVCSDASMRSRNVKQEIQLGWKYRCPYLPLLLELTSFPEQLEYWLEGWQWIEVMNLPPEQWLPQVLEALRHIGVQCHNADQALAQARPIVHPTRFDQSLNGLRSVAKFTDQIWPLPADRVKLGFPCSVLRDLGAPQDDVRYGHPLGSRVCLAIESDREGHLLLLDEGPTGKIYCLCPSQFAPDTKLRPGRSFLPQASSPYNSFVVTGRPGREHLLAIIADEPLELDWIPTDLKIPARVLNHVDVDTLLSRLRDLEGNRWIALSTYFDVLPNDEQKE